MLGEHYDDVQLERPVLRDASRVEALVASVEGLGEAPVTLLRCPLLGGVAYAIVQPIADGKGGLVAVSAAREVEAFRTGKPHAPRAWRLRQGDADGALCRPVAIKTYRRRDYFRKCPGVEAAGGPMVAYPDYVHEIEAMQRLATPGHPHVAPLLHVLQVGSPPPREPWALYAAPSHWEAC
jgi:hypothetical protein